MKTCNDCIYFKRDACSIKGDCFRPLIDPKQPACSYFKQKQKPGLKANSPTMSKGMLEAMAMDMATRTFYDKADWMTRNTPMFKYPQVEKALRKWLEEIGIEVKEK